MLAIYRSAMIGQYLAALQTLLQCETLCPDAMWEGKVVNNTFCESLFHALFFADLYLGQSVADLRQQAFHQEHPEIFRDYEEMEDRVPTLLYTRDMIRTYGEFVMNKVAVVVNAETEDTLGATVGFEWLEIKRAEMHPYNIRHIQHHAAQLILKLRSETDTDPKWFRSG